MLLDQIIGVVAPHSCLICGREGRLVCAWCEPDSIAAVPSRCYRCHAQTQDFSVCASCRRISPLKHVWVRGDYADIAKQLVQKFKFQHARAAAADIARLMAQYLPYFAGTIIVPLPTATRRVRQRGFDHTKLLAAELSRKLDLPVSHPLARMGHSQQVGTKRAQRIKQIDKAFIAVGDVTGQKILLIDDVTTTGASLEAAARALKRAGAKQVDAAVFAQAK